MATSLEDKIWYQNDWIRQESLTHNSHGYPRVNARPNQPPESALIYYPSLSEAIAEFNRSLSNSGQVAVTAEGNM